MEQSTQADEDEAAPGAWMNKPWAKKGVAARMLAPAQLMTSGGTTTVYPSMGNVTNYSASSITGSNS